MAVFRQLQCFDIGRYYLSARIYFLLLEEIFVQPNLMPEIKVREMVTAVRRRWNFRDRQFLLAFLWISSHKFLSMEILWGISVTFLSRLLLQRTLGPYLQDAAAAGSSPWWRGWHNSWSGWDIPYTGCGCLAGLLSQAPRCGVFRAEVSQGDVAPVWYLRSFSRFLHWQSRVYHMKRGTEVSYLVWFTTSFDKCVLLREWGLELPECHGAGRVKPTETQKLLLEFPCTCGDITHQAVQAQPGILSPTSLEEGPTDAPAYQVLSPRSISSKLLRGFFLSFPILSIFPLQLTIHMPFYRYGCLPQFRFTGLRVRNYRWLSFCTHAPFSCMYFEPRAYISSSQHLLFFKTLEILSLWIRAHIFPGISQCIGIHISQLLLSFLEAFLVSWPVFLYILCVGLMTIPVPW